MSEKTQEDLLREHRNEENRKECREAIDSLFNEAIKKYGEPKLKFSIKADREDRHIGEGYKWQGDNSAIDPLTKTPTARGEILSLTISLCHPADPNNVPNLLENILDKNGE
jgi:hypothetical protein